MADHLWMLWFLIPIAGGVSAKWRQAAYRRHQRKLELIRVEQEREKALAAASRPPEPICGCDHHLAKHDKQGVCHETIEAATAWDADHRPTAWESRPCACQQYVGPEPLSTIYAPDLTDG
jgi:hypothetical protein